MKAIFYLIIATILLGLNFHLAKVILKEVTFIEAGFWRFLFGVVTLIVLGAKKLPSFNIIQKNLKGISLTGFIGLFGFNLFFFLGLLNTSAVNAALIVSFLKVFPPSNLLDTGSKGLYVIRPINNTIL